MPITPQDRPLFSELCARAGQLTRDIVRIDRMREDLDRLFDEAYAEHDAVHAIIDQLAPDADAGAE